MASSNAAAIVVLRRAVASGKTSSFIGFYMVSIWFLYGVYVVSIWFLCGFSIVSIWFLYGFYMVSIRFLYGFYTRETIILGKLQTDLNSSAIKGG